MGTRTPRGFGQYDGVARAVERVGERWALLIVRDLLSGARRYGDLKAGLPRIPTNILSDRLRELQEAGVLRRVPVVRGGYELTALGRSLEPVVLALERWGWPLLGEIRDGETVTADALAAALRAAFRPEDGLPATEYLLRVGAVTVSAIVDGGELDVLAVGSGALPSPQRRVDRAAPADVLEFELTPGELSGLLGDGPVPRAADPRLAERFRRTFRMGPAPASDVPAADAAVA